MKVLSIVGARPQFIKAGVVSRELRKKHNEILVHTGQHYDDNMSQVFFDELQIPRPEYNLEIGSGYHGKQTGRMLERIEEILLIEKPDYVNVYGDTNSTLAGALAASKLHIPIIHVEAGLRSYNKNMPEEQNRILTDHISTILACPTETAVSNLLKENINETVCNTGDVMFDAIIFNREIALNSKTTLADYNLESKKYILATIHRAENTDNHNRLSNILNALSSLGCNVILPMHPRTLNIINKSDELKKYLTSTSIKVIEPVSYLDMINLESQANVIMTDSGGVQKEAFILKVPCITLRDETEWVETLNEGWNSLVGANYEKITYTYNEIIKKDYSNSTQGNFFGSGNAGYNIVNLLK